MGATLLISGLHIDPSLLPFDIPRETIFGLYCSYGTFIFGLCLSCVGFTMELYCSYESPHVWISYVSFDAHVLGSAVPYGGSI